MMKLLTGLVLFLVLLISSRVVEAVPPGSPNLWFYVVEPIFEPLNPGDTVYFEVEGGSRNGLSLSMECVQEDEFGEPTIFVYSETKLADVATWQNNGFTLPFWTGPADCRVELFQVKKNGSVILYAYTTFVDIE